MTLLLLQLYKTNNINKRKFFFSSIAAAAMGLKTSRVPKCYYMSLCVIPFLFAGVLFIWGYIYIYILRSVVAVVWDAVASVGDSGPASVRWMSVDISPDDGWITAGQASLLERKNPKNLYCLPIDSRGCTACSCCHDLNTHNWKIQSLKGPLTLWCWGISIWKKKKRKSQSAGIFMLLSAI